MMPSTTEDPNEVAVPVRDSPVPIAATTPAGTNTAPATSTPIIETENEELLATNKISMAAY